MGPWSGDHGNPAAESGRRVRRGASMGPWSGDHGNLLKRADKALAEMLQWGRGLVTTETHRARRP